MLIHFPFRLLSLQIDTKEVNDIVSNLNNADVMMRDGITVAGDKYFVLRNAERNIIGKKGAGGVHIFKTERGIFKLRQFFDISH